MSSYLQNLNDQQKEAVLHKDTPLLVLAGAGSGKTKVLTHRIAHLLESNNYKANNIMAVTFTNKAANEMRERLTKLVKEKQYFNFLGTFHSICIKILRKDGRLVGIEPSFTIYDDSDSKQIIKEIYKEINLNPKQLSPNVVNWIISQAKNNMVWPENFDTYAVDKLDMFVDQISDIYKRYQKILDERNALDFDDILLKTIKLFKNKSVIDKYVDQFNHILVDEYQDTNKAQYTLIRNLAIQKGNITVVGDEDQAIYGWRGADIQNILDFEKDFKKAKIIKLEQNYRSTQNILDAAYFIINQNTARREKRLWSAQEGGKLISIYEALNQSDEARFIAKTLKEKYMDNLQQVGVLYRANAQSRSLEEEMIKSKIPYRLIGGIRFYDRKEVKDMLAYLRMLNNTADTLSLLRIINTPPRKIGPKAITSIIEASKKAKSRAVDLLKSIAVLEIEKGIDKEGVQNTYEGGENLKMTSDTNEDPFADFMMPPPQKKEKKSKKVKKEERVEENVTELEIILNEYKIPSNKNIVAFAKMVYEVDSLLQDQTVTLREFIEYLIEKVGYINYISDGTKESENKVENLKEMLSVALRYDDLKLKQGLRKFLEDVALLEDMNDKEKSTNAVNLMTVHAAKGLEFDAVFLPGMEEGIFPHSRALTDAKELEEERRLAYVAVTRARTDLYIIYARQREYFGKTQNNESSRFVADIPHNLVEVIDLYTGYTGDTYEDSSIDEEPTEQEYIDIGDNVTHPLFGNGKIKDIENDIIIVDFEREGEKKLVIQFANLKKI